MLLQNRHAERGRSSHRSTACGRAGAALFHLEGVKQVEQAPQRSRCIQRKGENYKKDELFPRFNSKLFVIQVYDVSEFLNRHPGGVDQILLGAGRDITQLFESYHNLEVVG